MTPDREALIHAIELRTDIAKRDHHGFVDFPYEMVGNVLALLKEQEAMNVDAFVQWCIDSHIMGDATVSGIKYWVEKYKEIKDGR